ncbi:MAG: SMI1/KNR4 family protein [Verrucomicrobiota bacterium]
MSDLDDLLIDFDCQPGASEASIRNLGESVQTALPEDYITFLRKTNGGEGMIGKSYVVFWKAEEVVRLNNSYQVNHYAPGLLLLGSDGGGEAFAFDTRKIPLSVVEVPFVGMELQYATELAPSFHVFLERLLDE